MLAFNKDAATELQVRVEERLEGRRDRLCGLEGRHVPLLRLSVIGEATGRNRGWPPWLDAGGTSRWSAASSTNCATEAPRVPIQVGHLPAAVRAHGRRAPSGGEPDAYDYNTKLTGLPHVQRRDRQEPRRAHDRRLPVPQRRAVRVRDARTTHDVADAQHSQYRPDFYYPDVDVWHEHWAIDRDGKPPAEFAGTPPASHGRSRVHQRFGTTLIETTWAAIIDQTGFAPARQRAEGERAGARLEPRPASARRHAGQARGPRSADALVHGSRQVELANPRRPRPPAEAAPSDRPTVQSSDVPRSVLGDPRRVAVTSGGG